jgi:regulator of sigma E protease
MHFLHVIVEFGIVLGFMVLIHELGHFAVAKWCGVRVEAFSIGFGPRLFGVRYGGTDYKLSLLPLGGYVKMSGELPVAGEHSHPQDPGDFTAHPRWQRVLIALAGPFANFILSFCLLLFLSMYHHEVDEYLDGPAILDYAALNTTASRIGIAPGDTIVRFNNKNNPTWEQIFQECALNLNHSVPITFTHDGQQVSRDFMITAGSDTQPGSDTLDNIGLIPRESLSPISIQTVSGGTAADRAGLKPGDQIVRIDSLEPHSVNTLHIYLKDRAGAPANLLVRRDGQMMTVNLTPEHVESAPSYAQYQIGFLPKPIPTKVIRLPFTRAAHQSVQDNLEDSTLVLRIIKGMFTRHVSVKSLSGPVGIAQQIDLATQNSYWTLVRLMSSISLQLGIMNLVPFPLLDGGMILFLIVESLMRRDLNQDIKERVYQVAFVCLIVFATFVLFNDITKLHSH